MTQDKLRRVITAIAVACTALFMLLLAFLTYQWITMGVQKNRKEELQAEVDAWAEQNANLEEDLQYYSSDYYKWLEAIQRFDLQGK